MQITNLPTMVKPELLSVLSCEGQGPVILYHHGGLVLMV